MGVGGETACDMTQGVGAALREDDLRDPTAKCLVIGYLDALPDGSAITFSADQLETWFSGGGSVLADTKTVAAIVEGLANTCECSFAHHGDTGTFTKNLIEIGRAHV